ncbi:TPA: hypothetical protein IAC10_10320 [Candidatus Scatousia excrementigallinarum]|uniref:DUF6471 domain-containing protein n=1 Tax=Candidatus Scatousia excrementigallinarum TaxID=2840935 RepID=A0A9D1F0L3_9BACT|nr:hypothetical protein [Candidatus Scatousia excrementigallinarum]
MEDKIKQLTKQTIKAALALAGLTYETAAESVNKVFNRKQSASNIANKISRNTLKLSEFIEILEANNLTIDLRRK